MIDRGDRNGPPILRRLSALLTPRLTAWQTVVITLLWLYISRNFGKLVGLECPEPLANLYSRSYFRATWITTALDAGFWTAMRIRWKWARDFWSVIFSVFYMFCAEQADEKVRKVRGALTVDHLRVSWDKGNTPYIAFFTKLLRPRFMRYPPREIRIRRPRESSYKDPVHAWLYFDGPLSALKTHTKIILDIPGGGFVAMDPRAHDDKLIAWAGKTGLPVLSVDYKKAPEYPYPHALNECYDVYHMLHASRGRCVGLSGEVMPKIIVSGDSAGGNLAVGMILMALQAGTTSTRRWQGEQSLPLPEGVVLVYPALDFNIGNWMTEEQMALIRDRRSRKVNQSILRRKSDDYRKLTPSTPHHSDDEDEVDAHPNENGSLSPVPPKEAVHTSAGHTVDVVKSPPSAQTTDKAQASSQTAKPQMLKTRLAMSSMISYFNDRILTPEMMRAMIILYIGPHNRPDFATDFLLSPLLAPEALLARFPRTYLLTGERDPLVDDTVIFAGRIRQAKLAQFEERKELGLERERASFREEDYVEVSLIPGISHGFLQFVGIFPEGWRYIFRCARWMKECFERSDAREASRPAAVDTTDVEHSSDHSRRRVPPQSKIRHHFRTRTESSGDDDRPLEMSMSKINLSSTKETPHNGAVLPRPSSPQLKRYKTQSEEMTHSLQERRRKSLVSLASEDDLLGRRMRGLTGALLGGDAANVPKTPGWEEELGS
ncbi:MAG: hypothetical protein Q9157_002733 [Trypethelium eluteriae]